MASREQYSRNLEFWSNQCFSKSYRNYKRD